MELSTGRIAIQIKKVSCYFVGIRTVVDGNRTVYKNDFPDPTEQAEALLEFCQGDIDEAQGIAATNLKFANYEADRLYWARVQVLISKAEPEAVMERLLANRRKRIAVQRDHRTKSGF